MTITTPLIKGDFAALLPYAEFSMWLDLQQDISGDGRGNYYTADIGPPIWRGQIKLSDTMTHAEAADIQAIIESLDGAKGSFYLSDPRLPFPIRDPLGNIIRPWSTAMTISEVASNNKEIKLTGLPGNYWLTRGDRFHFDFGSSPVHRAYHRIVNTVQAGSGGNTSLIEIRPPLIDGASVLGQRITLDRPAAEWIIPPQGYQTGTGRRTLTPGGTIKIQQVL